MCHVGDVFVVVFERFILSEEAECKVFMLVTSTIILLIVDLMKHVDDE